MAVWVLAPRIRSGLPLHHRRRLPALQSPARPAEESPHHQACPQPPRPAGVRSNANTPRCKHLNRRQTMPSSFSSGMARHRATQPEPALFRATRAAPCRPGSPPPAAPGTTAEGREAPAWRARSRTAACRSEKSTSSRWNGRITRHSGLVFDDDGSPADGCQARKRRGRRGRHRPNARVPTPALQVGCQVLASNSVAPKRQALPARCGSN